jgi:hypothetical protein
VVQRVQRRAPHHAAVQQTRQHVHSRATLWLRLLARLSLNGRHRRRVDSGCTVMAGLNGRGH